MRRGLALILVLATAPLGAQGGLQKKLGDLGLKGRWYYDDVKGGFARARRTGRPLMIVFR